MAMTIDIPQTVTPIDALWAHFVSLPKGVRDEFVNRVRFFMNNEQPPCAQLSINDINARFDQAEAEIESGDVLSSEEVRLNIEKKCSWL